MLESFESQADVLENAKYASDQLAAEIENMIYEMTGKNSRDKAYREKSKKIMTRLKGARNSQLRMSLRSGNMTVSEFCKLSDRQIDDDSYFDKLFNNGNTNTAEPKKSMTRPPNLKNIPIKKIDLTTSFGEGMNDYFDGLKSNPEMNEQEDNQVTQEKIEENHYRNQPKLGIFNEDNNNSDLNMKINNTPKLSKNNFTSNTVTYSQTNEKLKDNNPITMPTTENDTKCVENDGLLEKNKPIQRDINRVSPKNNNGRSIQFNPVSKNDNINVTMNQTYNHGSNRPNFVKEKEKEVEIPNLNVGNVGKAYNKLEELKGLMQKHKQVNKNVY